MICSIVVYAVLMLDVRSVISDGGISIRQPGESPGSSVNCSFSSEDLCGYRNNNDTEPRWKRQTSRTAGGANQNFPMEGPHHGEHHIQTGPTDDEEQHGAFAEIQSPEVQVEEKSCLYFSYHNRLPFQLTSTLEVRVRMENSSSGSILAQYLSMDSPKWFEARVPLPLGTYRLSFLGKNYYKVFTDGGVVAVNNVAVLKGGCAKSVPSFLERPGDCGFENRLEMCGYSYTNDSTTRMLEFQRESLQQFQNHQGPSDRFLGMTGKFYQITSHDSTSRIQSPIIQLEKEGCFFLWYFNSIQSSGSTKNALNVLSLIDGKPEMNLLFKLPSSKSNRGRSWNRFSGPLPTGSFRLIIEALYTSDYEDNDYIGFDNIEIFNRSCSELENMKDVCTIGQSTNRNICQNGGSCIGTGKKSFRCDCGTDFFGDRCELSYPCQSRPCLNGGVCSNDGRVNIFCRCRPGFTGSRCSERLKCGSPNDVIWNSRLVSFANDSFQSTARFECLNDFTPIGMLTATCSEGGEWKTDGKCLPVQCDHPQQTMGQAILLEVSNRTLNGRARYVCKPGFTFPHENNSYLTCRSLGYSSTEQFLHGTWLTNAGQSYVQCHQIPVCGPPPNITNAVLGSVTSEEFLGIATFRCLEGYQMNFPNETDDDGVFTITCSEHGWKAGAYMQESASEQNRKYRSQFYYNTPTRPFQCWSIPDCGPPPDIPGGTIVRPSQNNLLNSSVVYGCEPGYHMLGSGTAYCAKVNFRYTGEWVKWIFVPSCERVCKAKVGRSGNATVAVLQISKCSGVGLDMTCSPPVEHAYHRKYGRMNKRKEDVVFYGKGLCIGQKTTRVVRSELACNSYRGGSRTERVVLSNVTRCKSFCLHYPSDIRYFTTYEEYVYHGQTDATHGYGEGYDECWAGGSKQKEYQYYIERTQVESLFKRTVLKYAVRP